MTVADTGPGPHQLMTVHEVAAALRVSRATVYRMVHTGALPGTRIGKSVRVTRRVVEDLLRSADTGESP